MRLRTKFALAISACLLLYFAFTTFILSTQLTSEQEANLTDLQSTLAIFSRRTLEMRMALLHSQLEAVLGDSNFTLTEILAQIKGGLGAEVWKGDTLLEATTMNSHFFAPPAGSSPWALVDSPLNELRPAIRWIGRYGEKTLAVDVEPEWFTGVLESTHGSSSQLVLSDAHVLLQSGLGPPAFHNIDLVKRMASEAPAIPQTIQYESDRGERFVGTFLPLQTEPTLLITIVTPWSNVQEVVYSMFKKSAWVTTTFLLLSVMLGILFASKLTESLQALAEQALEVGRGNFKSNISRAMKRNDEVGMFAQSFDKMIRELDGLRQELRQSERLSTLGQVGASLAHEMKNPLANILLNEQVLEIKLKAPQWDKAVVDRSLKFIKDEAQRATGIITSLMKFARQDKPPQTPIDLTEALRHSISLLRAGVENAGASLAETLPNRPILALVDPDQLHEVLANLVGNATHALRGRSLKRIKLILDRTDDAAVIKVEDTGSGMPESVRQRLFEPFFTTKKFGEGTGLGLAICDGIVRAHHGNIKVDSRPDVGTCFTITFPLAHAAASKKAA